MNELFRMYKYNLKNVFRSKIIYKKASSIFLLEDVENEELIHKEFIEELNATFEIRQSSSPIFPIIKVYIKYSEEKFNVYRFKIKNIHPIFKRVPDIILKYLKQFLNEKPDDTYTDLGYFHPKTNLQAVKAQYNFQVADEWPGLKHLPLE